MSTNNSVYVTITFFRGWLVAYSAAAFGLVAGILYVWSVLKAGIPDAWGWSNADKALPYALMASVFAVMMVPAGRLQDSIGPRPMVFLGGFLIGLGCVISGLGGSSLPIYLLGFGVLSGIGISFGFASLTPTAVKWFPDDKTGLITGIVVSGVGLAPVIMAPYTAWLLDLYSLQSATTAQQSAISSTMISIGITLWVATGLVGWFVTTPPMSFSPNAHRATSQRMIGERELTWKQMLATVQFWLLFIMFFIGSSAGLVFIGVAADLGRKALQEWAFLTVVLLSIGNAFGRIAGGVVSDKIGRYWTIIVDYLFQSLVVFFLYRLILSGGASSWLILTVVFLIGMNYGAIHAVFPATCKDFFGIRHFGHNYGCLFLAFGAAGLIMPWVNGKLQDLTGRPDYSYLLIICMLSIVPILAFFGLKLGQPQQPIQD